MVDFTAVETLEQEQWRQEVREFLARELPPGEPFDWDYDEDDAGWGGLKRLFGLLISERACVVQVVWQLKGHHEPASGKRDIPEAQAGAG